MSRNNIEYAFKGWWKDTGNEHIELPKEIEALVKIAFASGAVFGSLGAQVATIVKGNEGVTSNFQDMVKDHEEIEVEIKKLVSKMKEPEPSSQSV